MKLPVMNAEGKELRTLEVDDSVFGITPNTAVVHQAFVRQRANQRAGTVMTKTRGEVQGSTRKMRMQKYTGRARAGSNRAPTRVGGGIVFGPRPRDYSQDMPKKMRRLAIRSALSGKVADGQLVIIDNLSFEQPQTKEIIRILGNVGFNRSALVITGEPDRAVHASVRNLDRVASLPAAYLNVGDMMNHAGLLMTEQAVRVAEGLWAVKPREEKAPKAAPAKAKKPAAPAEVKAEPEAAAVAEPEATSEPEKAPAPRRRAAKAEASAEAAVAEKPKKAPAKPKTAAKPKAEGAAKPKPAGRKKAETADEKPKRPTTKKTEGTEGTEGTE
jgi:large subunit ribosomal protein L4